VASVGAIGAARIFALGHDLPSGELAVLKDGSNLIVHLRPAPVILRIATLTARIRRDPLPYLAREVALVSYLAGVGAPVMPPSDLVPAGPYLVEGWALSAWQFVEHLPERVPDVRAAFAALDELHAAMRGFPGELPWLNPAMDDFDRALAFALEAGLLGASEAADLTGRRDLLADQLRTLAPEWQPLHGDSFARNAVCTVAGPVWLDFEDCCSGPPVWDFATLVRRDPDPGLVAEIERRHGQPALDVATALRVVQVEPWSRIHEARRGLGW
jgi:hypothetical protein